MVSPLLLLLLLLLFFCNPANGSLFPRSLPFAAKKPRSSIHPPTSDVCIQEVLDRFQKEAGTVPLVARRRSSVGNTTIDIRAQWQDDKNLLTFCQVSNVPLMPSAFARYFQRLDKEMTQADVTVQSVVPIEQGRALKGVLYAPFPCSNRLLLLWKLVRQPAPQEHLLLLTDRGNHGLVQRYRTRKEERSLVLAKATIAYWIQPVRDNNNQVIGSNLHYLFHGDIGGKIPKWIKNTVAPRAAYDTVHGLLKHLEKQQKQQ